VFSFNFFVVRFFFFKFCDRSQDFVFFFALVGELPGHVLHFLLFLEHPFVQLIFFARVLDSTLVLVAFQLYVLIIILRFMIPRFIPPDRIVQFAQIQRIASPVDLINLIMLFLLKNPYKFIIVQYLSLQRLPICLFYRRKMSPSTDQLYLLFVDNFVLLRVLILNISMHDCIPLIHL
jgi:hypothetical protein